MQLLRLAREARGKRRLWRKAGGEGENFGSHLRRSRPECSILWPRSIQHRLDRGRRERAAVLIYEAVGCELGRDRGSIEWANQMQAPQGAPRPPISRQV